MTSSQSRKVRKVQEKIQRKLHQEQITFEFPFGRGNLAFHGPIITTDLGITEAHAAALNRAGLPVPTPVRCRFLIDTGADCCLVRHEIAEAAGLKLIQANTPIHGVGVDTSGRTYMGRIWLVTPSKISPGALHKVAVDTQIHSGNLPSEKIDGLIGRDVLVHFEMHYYGASGDLVMKYHRPGPG